MSNTLNEIAKKLKASNERVQLIYAFNGSGKTRLSREFKDLLEAEIEPTENSSMGVSELSSKNIIYYNAFTEDLFYWDNDLLSDSDRKLKIHSNTFTKWVLEEQGLGNTIITHFQRLTNSNIEPVFSTNFSEVSFIVRGDEQRVPVKISKGEESNLIWCIFYSFLSQIVEELSSTIAERSTTDFNNLKYVFIDDPVSSLDDNHLIELAVDLAKLVKSSTAKLKFIITTHNPLFYNVLSNELENKLENKLAKQPTTEPKVWLYQPKDSKKYRLDKKINDCFVLKELNKKTPFSYHLQLLSDIRAAIIDDQVKKYHFNFMRNLMEKTATFLGHDNWVCLLPKDTEGNPDPVLNRLLNSSSHSAHAGEETGEVIANGKDKLEELVNFLSSEYRFSK